MTRIFVAVPSQWEFLAAALRQEGHEVRSVHEGYAHYPLHSLATGDAPLTDLRKAIAATTPADALPLVNRLLDKVGDHEALACFVRQGAQDCQAIVVTYTADVLGRAAIEAGRAWGVPVIHVQHACYSVLPEDAWYLRDTPGDLVLAPGERDRHWWGRCAPEAKVVVTGQPLWDSYHGMQRTPTDPPTILWVCESGANAYQSPTIWQHRDTPERAYALFLAALQQVETPTTLLLKARDGEETALVRRWVQQAVDALRGTRVVDIALSTERPQDVLPEVSLAVGVQSNLLVEAMHLNIPTLSIAHLGVELLPVVPLQIDAQRSLRMAQLMAMKVRPTWDGWRDPPTRFNRGVDGQALKRVLAAIGRVARAGVAAVHDEAYEWEREAVPV